MSTIHEKVAAVRGLSPDDSAVYRVWFAKFDADPWDRQFEDDVAAGRLDAFAKESLS